MENVDMEMYSRTVSQTNTVELSGKVVFLETLEVLYSYTALILLTPYAGGLLVCKISNCDKNQFCF